MMSWGHIKGEPDDGYNPHKQGHEGYYVGVNQDPNYKSGDPNATDDNPNSIAAKSRDEEKGAEEGGEEEKEGDGNGATNYDVKDEKAPLPEKLSVLQPLSYLRRADNNFFGGRTTFYT